MRSMFQYIGTTQRVTLRDGGRIRLTTQNTVRNRVGMALIGYNYT